MTASAPGSDVDSGAVVVHFDSRAGRYQQDSDRWVWRWMRNRERRAVLAGLDDVAGYDVLELGCGSGYFARLLVARGAARVVAVDLSEAMVASLPGPPIDGVVGDAATVTLGRTFDRLLCAGLLEFVPDPAQVLVNARRHADQGGRLVVLYPRQNLAGRGYRRYHKQHGFAIHLFRLAIIEAMAAGAGWRCVDSHPVAPFSGVATFEAVSP